MSLSKLLMLDLGSGLAGASQAMKARGWQVVTVDINPAFEPDIVADLTTFTWDGPRPDLIWGSPPCNEFSREFMPWCKTGVAPDMSLVLACLRIIREARPRYWVIENVMGALPWFEEVLGKPKAIYGPFYLWGFFPSPGDFRLKYRKKESFSSRNRAERAKVPHQLSEALALAVEGQRVLT